MQNRIKGRRIHFAGSASQDIDPTKLLYMHSLIRMLTKRIVAEGCGLVVTLGSEPKHKDNSDLPLIFDWTLLESFNECQNSSDFQWPEFLGLPVVAVGLPNWKDRIPSDRRALWENLVESAKVELIQVESGLSIGGVLRERQAVFGDVLVVAGGGPGVAHLAELYISNRKPVIPLDIQLVTGERGAAERLSILAIEHPERFFDYEPSAQAAAAYSMLSMRNNLQPAKDFEKNFFNFLNNLHRPKAFYVRLLNQKCEEFNRVERFFRSVVDPIVEEAGFQRFEMMKETTREAFLNVEIFEMLLAAALVIVDLTGLRSNCLLELGYALGLKKKVIITAQEGTRLPFDTYALPCYFWSSETELIECKTSFQEFIRKHINREPINRNY